MDMHTPGPWFVPKENAGSAATSVWARGGDVRVADCNSGGVSLPGRQADARLISAAPTMLAELQEIASWARTERIPLREQEIKSIERVIALATGVEA